MASGRSIRFKISTLLVIPLISLVALWGFAASTTLGDALNLLTTQRIWTDVIDTSARLVTDLQAERLASAEQLAGVGVGDDLERLAKARAKVDDSGKEMRQRALSKDTASALTPDMHAQLQVLFEAVDRLPDIRAKVDDHRLAPGALVNEYAKITDEVHLLYARLTMGTDIETSLQAQGLIAADEVRELLAREHALVLASNGRANMRDTHLLAGIDGSRTYLFPKALANLDTELRAPFEKLYYSSRYVTMENLLEGFIGGRPMDVDLWRGIAEQVQTEFREAVYGTGQKLLARMEPAGVGIVVRAIVAGLIGLIAVVFSIVVSIRVGRRLAGELGTLRRTALELAEIRLPDVVAKLRKGDEVDIAAEAPPIRVGAKPTGEVADLAAAFDSVQSTAVDAAVEQARLREGVAEALRNLARRSQSLLQRQLKLLDEMQHQTEEPEALERLFKLDHLTTRMRRHAEGLVLLSGGQAGRRWRGVIPVEDVLSGAAAQVEEYTRVRVYPMPECGVPGGAVADLMHLFAELIENAASFSSPDNEVSVRGEMVGRGFAVEIEDRGLGMDDDAFDAVNARLASPPEFDPAQTERLGFSVVGMLAARHGVKVTLKPSPYGGVTAVVLVPAELVEPMAPPTQPLELQSVSVSVVRTDTETTGPGGLPRRVRTSRRGAVTQEHAVPHQAQPEPIGLPRRERRTPPQRLTRAPDPGESAAPPEERSPEQARALLSSLQSGWQRGRQEGDQDGGSES
ncbi:HAMP domain-containing protein [Nonomuraea maritima]|uniref:histidine kinase n=1 Tax=Nonomuraea maritima TaxID=683260 RepID=A0A1G9QFP7_9ACTN|nr:nitrate- and nitrite sensing domain-containing protein [Nonomuraea maritima]SDM09327.1 HAMP domain-containing protein [Nonomuraea maritima]